MVLMTNKFTDAVTCKKDIQKIVSFKDKKNLKFTKRQKISRCN